MNVNYFFMDYYYITGPEHTADKFIEIINNIHIINEVVFSFCEYEKMNIK